MRWILCFFILSTLLSYDPHVDAAIGSGTIQSADWNTQNSGTLTTGSWSFSGADAWIESKTVFNTPAPPFYYQITFTLTSVDVAVRLWYMGSSFQRNMYFQPDHSIILEFMNVYSGGDPFTITWVPNVQQTITLYCVGNQLTVTNTAGSQSQTMTLHGFPGADSVPAGQITLGSRDGEAVGVINSFLFAPGAPGGATGDPVFAGFQGQSFQVHGYPMEYFNLFSTPQFQLNGRFSYIASGKCDYNNTQCWTHPGTYIDEIGILGVCDEHISIRAGSHKHGLHAIMNGKPMEIGMHLETQHSKYACLHISHPTHDRIRIISHDILDITIINSNEFFNIESFILHSNILTVGSTYTDMKHVSQQQQQTILDTTYNNFYKIHGLIGQTWRNIRYANNKYYEGYVDDYVTGGPYEYHHLYSVFKLEQKQ